MPSDPPAEPPTGGPPPPPVAGRGPPRGPTGPASRFAEPRRLHPASVVLGVNLRQILQAFLVPAAATFTAGGRVMLVVLVLAGLVGLIGRTLAWQRFTYSFDGEVLRVSEGVLSRNQRALDVARIQQVEIDRSVAQRLLGLAALRVETAGSSSEVEVELRVVPEADAVALRSAVRESQQGTAARPAEHGQGTPATVPTRRTVLRVPLGHVVLASVTGVRLLVLPAVVAGALQFVGQGTGDWIERSVSWLLQRGVLTGRGAPGVTLGTVLVLAVAVLVLALATAVVVGILRDARFRVERVDEDLHVSRGLLSTRDSVLPLRRLQLVQVQRNWLRRLLGFSSVRVLSAGGSGDTDRRVTVPLLPDADVEALLGEVYPGLAGIPGLVSHPRPAVRRAVLRWLRVAALPVLAVWAIPWQALEAARLPALALLPLAVALGVVEYRHLAHGTDDRVVASRRGALSVTTSLAPLAKVQGASSRANPFQRRLGLATVRAHVAGPGGDVEVLDTGAGEAGRLLAELTRHAAEPTAIRPERTTAPLL